MLHPRWILAASLFAAPALAQPPERPIIPPETAAPADAAGEIRLLAAEYNKAVQEYYKPWREARAKKQEYKLDYAKHPQKLYAPRFREVARMYAGGDGAIDAWVWTMRTGGDRTEALDVLMRDHIDSKKMSNVVGFLRYGPNGEASLEMLIEKSPHRDVQGFAMLTLGQRLMRSNDARAERMLVEVQKRYGDVPIYGGRMTAGKKAEGDLFEARNLAIGKVAPEIEGRDTDGVPFKLSDYRGKVVFLDFWGDW